MEKKLLTFALCAFVWLGVCVRGEEASSAAAGGDFKSCFAAGDAAYKKQQYAAAAEKLAAAKRLAATDWDRYAVGYRLAQCFFYLKKYPEAVAEALNARDYAKIDGKSRNILCNRIAESYLNMKKYDEAMKEIEAQLASPRREPENYFQTMLLKGQTLLEQKKFAEAVAAFQACEAVPPPSVQMLAKTQWFLGITAEQQGNVETAKKYFRKNIDVDGGWFTKDSKRRLDLLNQPSASRNILPDSSFEYGGRGAWNRMIDQSYLVSDNRWVPDATTAFHGRYSLRGEGGNALILQAEGDFSNGFFSVYLKGEKPCPEVKIEVFTYESFTPFELASEVVKITPEWARYAVRLKRKWLPMEPAAAPVMIRITPQGSATVWADAVQLETPQLTAYHDYQPSLRPAAEAQKILRERFVLPPTDAIPVRAAGREMLGARYSFQVKYPQAARAVPICVGLPLPAGQWQGSGMVAVRAADGKLHPAQVVITGRWPRDGSVRAAAVHFVGDLQAGLNSFTIEPAPAAVPAAAVPAAAVPAAPVTPEITIFAEDATRQTCQVRETLRRTEIDGALFQSELRRGLLCQADGMVLAEYSLRIHRLRADGTLTVECTITNPHATELVLSCAGVRIASGQPGVPMRYFQAYSPAAQKFALPPDGACGWVGGSGGTLLMREASLRHPAELAVDKNGCFTAWLWPSTARQLILSRKMGLTREFIYSPSAADDVPARLGQFPVAMVAPETFVNSNIFLLPLGRVAADAPFARRRFDALRAGQAQDPEKIFNIPNQTLHGVFNYGDVYGDRGWGNLESYLDLAEMWLAVGVGDIDMFGSSLNRARHYRDVDIVDGMAAVHGPNHTGSWIYEFSHSWPQGVILHYLLTGDPRSAEVVERMIDNYLSKPITYKYIQDSRSLGRYLLGLVDFYALTGRADVKARFFAQLNHAEKCNLGTKFKDLTIFHWLGRTDPFHVWYGACALMEMYELSGDAKLLRAFQREMDASLNMDFFRHDLNELWPGLPIEKTWPIQLGYQTHHRGSLFYPLMRFYSENCGKPEYRRIAALAAYAEFLRGEPYPAPMDILRTAVLGGEPEAELLAEALDLRRRAAAPATLLNGDFGQSQKWFTHWHLPADRQMSYDELAERWPLRREQDFKKLNLEYNERQTEVSPWRAYARNYGYLDTEFYHAAPPALRVTVGQWSPHGNTAWLESAPIWIPGGSWKFSGAFSMEAGVDLAKSVFICSYTAEKETKRTYRFHPNVQAGPAPVAVWYDTPILTRAEAEFSLSDRERWRKFEFRFEAPAPGIVTLKFIVRLGAGNTVAHAWFDDLKLEKDKP